MKLFYTLVAIAHWAVWPSLRTPEYNFDAQADFSKYKSYKWVTSKGPRRSMI